ncbi:MAG: sulfatase [Planctomycetota bacterium]
MTRVIQRSILVSAICLAAAVAVSRTASLSAAERPNVLFIAVDDLNHWVSYTGRNPQARTPNIDRLSKMGVSFSNAHCAAPACEPSRAALFSGMRPSTTGCYVNGDNWKNHVPEGVSLNATFKKSGYYTVGMGKTYHNSAVPGIEGVYASEWDEYPAIPEGTQTGGAQKDQGYHEPLPLDMKDEDICDWHTVNYCIEQLKKEHEKPFFVACGLVKPHLPWAVPRKYYELFPREDIELPPYREDDLADVPPTGQRIGNTTDHPRFIKSGRWKDAIQSYLATIAYVDGCIGRLLDALEQSAYKDNTIIVLWGDHGWHLGEKDHWRKFTLWEEATRAPLIWVAPGVTKAGSVCDKPVDFLSIYPTLCDLAGIETPDHVEGKSLRPLLADPQSQWDGVALTTHGYMNHAVRSGRWRYIRLRDGSEELYDHTNDPYEWTNLATSPEYNSERESLAKYLPQKNVDPPKKSAAKKQTAGKGAKKGGKKGAKKQKTEDD